MRETMSEHDGDDMSSGGPEAARAPRRVEELLATIDRQREELDLLAADLMRVAGERDGVVAERDRLAAELRAVWGKRDGLPRTSSELRAWRRERELTQKEAARRLGVGHATVERAEEKEPGAALGRVLRKALERDAVQTREAVRGAAAGARPETGRSGTVCAERRRTATRDEVALGALASRAGRRAERATRRGHAGAYAAPDGAIPLTDIDPPET